MKVDEKKSILGISIIIVFLIFNLSSSCGAEELTGATPDSPQQITESSVNGSLLDVPSASGALKLMTFNIHHGADLYGMFNLGAIVEVIRQSGADIIALQEVDRYWGGRSLYYDEAHFIAEQLCMNYAYGANITQNPFRSGSGEYGIMLLSKYPIISSTFRLLPSLMEQRGILLCLIQTPDLVITVACTHLGLSALDWDSQVTDILDWLPPGDDAVLMGDFNRVIGADVLRRFEGRLIDLQQAFGLGDSGTFPFNETYVRIDYILGGTRWRPVNCQVIPGQSSDHLPVYVEVEPAPIINVQEISSNTPDVNQWQ